MHTPYSYAQDRLDSTNFPTFIPLSEEGKNRPIAFFTVPGDRPKRPLKKYFEDFLSLRNILKVCQKIQTDMDIFTLRVIE